jgi:hypothetical protein
VAFAVLDVAAHELVAEVPTGEPGGGADNAFWPKGGPATGPGIAINRYSRSSEWPPCAHVRNHRDRVDRPWHPLRQPRPGLNDIVT